jgi:uncharacterized membrane protein YtjA (UPF0391 family)
MRWPAPRGGSITSHGRSAAASRAAANSGLSIRKGINKYLAVPKEIQMLYYAVVFLVIALIAGALGFFGVAGAAVGIAKILFFVFLVLFVVSLLIGRGRRAGI